MLSSSFQAPSSHHIPCVVSTLLGNSSDGRAGRGGPEGVLVLIRGKEVTGGGAGRVGDRVCPRGPTCKGRHVTAGVGAAHLGEGGSQPQRREAASGQPRRLASPREPPPRRAWGAPRPLPNTSVHVSPCRALRGISRLQGLLLCLFIAGPLPSCLPGVPAPGESTLSP